MESIPRKKVSSLDVALRAGVSRATVSRCFSEGANVKQSTRKRVLNAARDLGYEPNLLARMLNKQESQIVAVITSDFENPFQPLLVEKLSEGIADIGFTPLFLKSNSVHESADELIQLALSYRVAAIVVTVLNASHEIITKCFASQVPLIFLNRVKDDSDAISICSDVEAGACRLAEVLAETGAKRIGMLTGRLDSWTNSMRRRGFRNRLDELGGDISASARGDFTYHGGLRASLRMIAKDPKIDAIYAGNDAMAFGALDALRRLGSYRVPDTMSVVGIDDVPMASWDAYRLSTFRQPVTELIEKAKTVLASADRGLGLAGQVFLFDGTFVQRTTTRKVSLQSGEVDDSHIQPVIEGELET
jgi:DNA-binding LacI/PurR family transcriptional regulator